MQFMKVSSLRFCVVLVLSLFLFSCKEEKPNYHFTFFNDIDKVEHITFENSGYESGIESINDTIPEIISQKIISKDNFKDLFELLSTEYKECGLKKCYVPRDILYFYKKGKKVGYYEFCKECGGNKTSSNLDSLPSFCVEKGKVIDDILE